MGLGLFQKPVDLRPDGLDLVGLLPVEEDVGLRVQHADVFHLTKAERSLKMKATINDVRSKKPLKSGRNYEIRSFGQLEKIPGPSQLADLERVGS